MPSGTPWTPARLKKFRATMKQKRQEKMQVMSIPIDALPDKPVRRMVVKAPNLEQAKLQLAHEVLQVLMKVLS
jgi:hypothetical protein